MAFCSSINLFFRKTPAGDVQIQEKKGEKESALAVGDKRQNI